MIRTLLALLCLTTAFLFSCESSTDPVNTAPFSFSVEVADPSGAPAEGLRVSCWNNIDGIAPMLSAAKKISLRPALATSIPFVTATKSHINITMFTFDNEPVDALLDTIVKAGRWTLAWGHTAFVPNGIYKCRMVASDTLSGETIFEETIYPVMHEFDPDRTVIGYTDSKGSYRTNNPLLFPYVLKGVPELLHIGLDGDPLGTLKYSEVATVVVTDTATGESLRQDVSLSKTTNVVSVVWNPPMNEQGANDSVLQVARPRLAADIDPPILVWRFGPNFPNPFN